jgi:hypothetical protein
MTIELLQNPVLVSPDYPWSGKRLKFPKEQFYFTPKEIYILIGTRINSIDEKNWMIFDFLLIDPIGEVLGLGWAHRHHGQDSMNESYRKIFRSFHPVR